MTNLKINYNNNTIEMSEKYSVAASKLNSNEYKELLEARNAFPTYKVIVVKTHKSNNKCQKGLNINYMKSYIENRQDTDNLAIINTLIEGKAPFFEIKSKFVEFYPIFKTLKTQSDIILAK